MPMKVTQSTVYSIDTGEGSERDIRIIKKCLLDLLCRIERLERFVGEVNLGEKK